MSTTARGVRLAPGPSRARAASRAFFWLVAALGSCGCGARTGIDEVPAAPRPDGADAGAPAACDTLRALGTTLLPFGDLRAEGAQVVARQGGFDVVAFVIADAIDYRARRIEIRGGAAVLGATGILGPEARSVGAVAARGSTLTLCYGDVDLEGPTRWVQTDDLDYASVRRSTLGDGPGDHCVALAAGPDRWLAAWQDRSPRALGWAVTEVDDAGRIVGPVRPSAVPALAATRRPGGFAWAEVDPTDRTRAHVMLLGDDRTLRDVEIRSLDGGRIDSMRIVSAAPAGSLDLELAWVDGARSLSTLVLHADGTPGPSALEPARAAIVDGPAVALVGARAAVTITACDRGLEGPGRLELRARDGATLPLLFAADRPSCPTRPAIASLGDLALLAWEEAERTHALLLTCAAP